VVSMPEVFERIAEEFAPLWAGGAGLRDMILGDVWRPLSVSDEERLAAFHLPALSMALSLIEPFAWAGLNVSGYDELPAPSDASHAVLFQQSGVLQLRRAKADADPVARMIELRAVTAGLWDSLADRVRHKLEADEDSLPNPCVLQVSRLAADSFVQKKPAEFHQLANFMNPGSVFWLPFGA